MGEGHVAKGGDNTTAWEKLLPTLDFSFSCRSRADSKPSSSAVQPALSYPCSLSQVFFPFFIFFHFFPFIRTCQLLHRRRLHLASPSHRRYPVSPPSTPSTPPQHCNYRTNPVATTTTATSPLAGTPTTRCTRPHTRRGHTQAIPPLSPFLAHLKKPQISHFPFFSPSSLTVQDTPLDTGLLHPPVARKHPPHLHSRACRPPLRHCHHNHLLNASTTGATSPTPSPYNWRLPTLPHRQGVQKVRWPPPFLRHPHLLTLPLCVGRPTHVAAPVAPPVYAPHPTRTPSLCTHAGGCRRDSAPTPSPLRPG